MLGCALRQGVRTYGLTAPIVLSLMVGGCASDPVGPSRVAASGDASGGGATEAAPNLKTYTDSTYGFSVQYPDVFVILSEPIPPTTTRPPAAHRVRFQDKDVAAGEFADREPARFRIEVFDAGNSPSLRSWLASFGRVPQGAVVSNVQVQGAREAVRVALAQQLAPNEFIYAATNKFVFGLTPLGEHSETMLASFRLLGQ